MKMKKVYVPGVFDMFHIGHLNYIKSAAKHGDMLIVGIQDDRSVLEHKGTKLVNSLPERIAIVEELRCVNLVISYTDVFQGTVLDAFDIDVFVCSEDYGDNNEFPKQKETLEFCRKNNIEIIKLERTATVSSTSIRSKLRDFWSSRAAKLDDLPAGVTVLGSFQGDQEKVEEESKREAELVLRAVENPAGKTLLDLGCGDGRLLFHLAPQFANSKGVDYSPELVNLAKQRLSACSPRPTFDVCDVTEYKDVNKYDVVLLSGVIPCLDDGQFEKIIPVLTGLSAPSTKLFIRTSIGIKKRLDIVNQYAVELNAVYTAYYRTLEEITVAFSDSRWYLTEKRELYQHRKETAVWWLVFDFEQDQK